MKAALILSIACANLLAQNGVLGPVAGWVWDFEKTSMRPVLGIPGASILGDKFDGGVRLSLAVSDQKRYVVGIGATDAQVYLIGARGGSARLLEEIPAGASRIYLSPSGDQAVFAYERRMIVVSGLPEAPTIQSEIYYGAEGAPSTVAVNDGARLILAAYPSGRSIMAYNGTGNRWRMNYEGEVRSLAFADSSTNVVIADDTGVRLVRNAAGNAEFSLLWEGDARAASISSDSKNAVVLSKQAQVFVVNLETGGVRALECSCEPTTVSRLAGGAVFRLNEGGSRPLWMVDLTGAQPRAVFVPADAKTEE